MDTMLHGLLKDKWVFIGEDVVEDYVLPKKEWCVSFRRALMASWVTMVVLEPNGGGVGETQLIGGYNGVGTPLMAGVHQIFPT